MTATGSRPLFVKSEIFTICPEWSGKEKSGNFTPGTKSLSLAIVLLRFCASEGDSILGLSLQDYSAAVTLLLR